VAVKCPKCQFENPADTRFCGNCAAPLESAQEIAFSKTMTIQQPQKFMSRGSTLAGKYRIVEPIGKGGMGVVYKAEDTKLKRTVALKFLPPDLAESPEAGARFIREAQAAAALSHPHICTVHEINEEEDQSFIVMEYIEGQSLRQKISKGPLDQTEALDIAIQVAEGLKEAHKKGIVHRDIKPGNIMLTDEGMAKVMDFGLAKALGSSLITKEAKTMGTVAYMSPEQAQGQSVDHRTDIWSLGVVLYEMIAGQVPFKGEYEQSIIHSILTHEPEPITKIRKDLPSGLQQVIYKILEKNPNSRYQRMEDFLDDLKAIAEGLKPLRAKAGLFRGRILGLKKIYAYAGLACIVILAVLAILFLPHTRGQTLDSIAVMPLENLSGDSEQDSLAESIHDDLITNLAGLRSLKTVIARRTVMRFKGKDTPPQKIAQELHVKALITGALRRSGDSVRVTAQLIDPATGSQVWAQSYERDMRDVNSLENEIVGAIAREVNLQLTPEEKSRLATARTVNAEAYVAYTKGRFYLNQLTPEGLQKGLEYMQQAIDKDPANPLPYAALALGYCMIGHGTNPPPDAFARAKEAALKADELGGTLAETQAALGQIRLFDEWDWEGGRKALQNALTLNPSLPDAQRMYSWYLLLTGRKDEAIATMKRAIEVDPLTPLWSSDLGWQYWSAGQYQEAMDAQQKALELNPNFGQGLEVLGYLYAEKGMFEEAIAAHQKLAAVNPRLKWDLVRTYALAGRQDEARKMLAELLEKEPKPTGARDGWHLVQVYAALGDKDEAFRWMEAAVKERNSFIPWMRQNPAYAPLRSDPRFQDLVRYMKLPELK
jgi:serine/threonine protein kinase/Flp pilus assembly protein TadD